MVSNLEYFLHYKIGKIITVNCGRLQNKKEHFLHLWSGDLCNIYCYLWSPLTYCSSNPIFIHSPVVYLVLIYIWYLNITVSEFSISFSVYIRKCHKYMIREIHILLDLSNLSKSLECRQIFMYYIHLSIICIYDIIYYNHLSMNRW